MSADTRSNDNSFQVVCQKSQSGEAGFVSIEIMTHWFGQSGKRLLWRRQEANWWRTRYGNWHKRRRTWWRLFGRQSGCALEC